jgi:hypothetical protein
VRTNWVPHEKCEGPEGWRDLPGTAFAFPAKRKEPLTDAEHVRNALARFDQVTGVSDKDRALAFANIVKAAEHYGVEVSEPSWRQLGVHPQTRRREAAAKAVMTRRRREERAEAAGKIAPRSDQRARRRSIRSRSRSPEPGNAG